MSAKSMEDWDVLRYVQAETWSGPRSTLQPSIFVADIEVEERADE
jgi:hypothetical protein